MSQKRMSRIISKGEKRRTKGKYIARTSAKKEQQIAKGAGAAAGLATVATTATAIAAGVSVAAPPFSTVAALIPMVVAGGAGGAKLIVRRGNRILAHDAKLVNKWAKRFRKRSTRFRKKKIIRTLRRYNRWLKKGNKRIFGRKRKTYRRWKRRKARLEMQLKALYIAEYGRRAAADTGKTTRIPKRRKAEKKVLRDTQKAQKPECWRETPDRFPAIHGPAASTSHQTK